MGYLFLAIAIICEVAGTAALKASEEFTKPIPSLIVVAGYAIAFVCLALTLRTIPVGIAYAIWAGCGIVLVALVSYALFGQKLDAPAIVGIGLITAGVVVVNVFSGSFAHEAPTRGSRGVNLCWVIAAARRQPPAGFPEHSKKPAAGEWPATG
jgi:small multidrug resistance pump